jgi:uridine kinase
MKKNTWIQNILKAYPQLELSDILVFLTEASFGDAIPLINKRISIDSLHLGEIELLGKEYAKVELISQGDYWISYSSVKKIAELSFQNNLVAEEKFLKEICDSKNYIKKVIPSTDFNMLHAFVDGYLRKNKPIMHSDSFLEKNPSSYFIVHQNYLDKLGIISSIDQLYKESGKALIAIDGNASSGKTTLASWLKTIYDANVFHMDDYFMKPVINRLDPFSIYASNINFTRLSEEILHPYHQESLSVHQLMDMKNHQLSLPIETPYKPITIIEGAYSMHPYIEKLYQLKIFMKTSYLEQIRRIYKRNGWKRMLVFMKKWIPMENTYFRDLNIAKQADLIIRTHRFHR